MIRKLILFILVLWIPATALADSDVYYTLRNTRAPYEPVTAAQPDMFPDDAELLTVSFIDRGAADCILLCCGGETMIVDGAAYNQFKFIDAALSALDVHHFDYMINTHAHDDHIEGLIALLKHDYPADVYMSCYEDGYSGSAEHTEVRKLLTERNIPYQRIGNGDHFSLGNAEVTVFRDETPGIDKNRHSLILKVVYHGSSVLLMADAGRQTQDYLLDLYDADVFKADVLKFAHHGMTTMSVPFLAAVAPELVIVTNIRSSVPRAEKQLATLHIPRYYTHTGVVLMQTDGNLWHAEQMPPDWP